MKKVFLIIIGLVLIVLLVSCNKSNKQGLYGTYTFVEVSYLSGLSSSTVDYIEKEMAGAKYIIEANSFKIESGKYKVDITSPKYVREEIPNDLGKLSDVRSFIGEEVKYQYTIFANDGEKTHKRLYVSSDCLWIASYADNTADGSEIIMYLYKLSK